MFKTLILATILSGCTPQEAEVVNDFIQGEEQTIEKVVQDTMPPAPSKPQVTVKKF